MNNQRRRELSNWIQKIENMKYTLESIKDDEEMYLDNMPENLQNSIKADSSRESIDKLCEALEICDEIIECVEDAKFC